MLVRNLFFFFKTDWSAGGMGCILVQPDNSPDFIAAIKHLEYTGDCFFGLTLSDLRLMHALFTSRSNLDHEKDYHSFVGAIASVL